MELRIGTSRTVPQRAHVHACACILWLVGIKPSAAMTRACAGRERRDSRILANFIACALRLRKLFALPPLQARAASLIRCKWTAPCFCLVYQCTIMWTVDVRGTNASCAQKPLTSRPSANTYGLNQAHPCSAPSSSSSSSAATANCWWHNRCWRHRRHHAEAVDGDC